MPDPTPQEPTVPTGSGDPAFDAALLEAGETPAADPTPDPPPDPAPTDPAPTDPPPANEPPIASDFTFATLENGERELRLASGQIYRGKDDAELLNKVAAAQLEASRHITTLNGRVKDLTPPPAAPPAEPTIDPTALAIADLLAPAFGAKNGAELVKAWGDQRTVAQQQQEYMAAQAANMEAANFFRAVPEFSKSQADADKIDGFLQQNNLPFNAATAEMAYHTLRAKGEFAAASAAPPRAPKNGMPPPPAGSAPANTAKGAPTEADLWSMTSDQLAELLTSASPQ